MYFICIVICRFICTFLFCLICNCLSVYFVTALRDFGGKRFISNVFIIIIIIIRCPTNSATPSTLRSTGSPLARYVEVLLGRQHVRNTGKAQLNKTIIEHANNGHSLLKQENGIDQEVKVDEEEDVENSPHHRNVKVEDEDEMSDAILKSLAMGQTMDLDESDDKDLSFGESKETFEKKPEPAGGGGGGDFASTSSMGGVKKPIHLSWAEMEGLINLVEFLESLPRSKRSVPELIDNPDKLLEDARVSSITQLNDVSVY